MKKYCDVHTVIVFEPWYNFILFHLHYLNILVYDSEHCHQKKVNAPHYNVLQENLFP